ncbi:hypothetical protein ARSEF4850_004213 [Beauveria asiatica]
MMHACSSRTVLLSRAACPLSRVVLVAAPRSRTLATATTTAHPAVGTTSRSHKVVIVGAGAAGASVSHQLLRSGGYYGGGDIAVVDPAPWHDYQPGWTGLFGHDLVEVDGDVAVFARAGPDGTSSTIRRRFDLLQAVPKMGPHAFVARSPLADAATGLVDVDAATLRHKRHGNVWALGDAAGLPTAKTAAAVTAQAAVLVANLLAVAEQGRKGDKDKEEEEEEEEEGPLPATYDGYTSCPLTTEYGKVLLAEFKYGGEPKETFARLGVDQAVPNRLFYHLKKDFFPWVYKKHMIKGTWGGPKGFLR